MMRVIPTLLALLASVACAPVALALNEYGIEGMGRVSTKANEASAGVSADGLRIVFASDRDGRWLLWQAQLQDKRWGEPQPLPVEAGSAQRDPFLSADGRWLYFAAQGRHGWDLYRAPADAPTQAQVLAAANSRGDERSPSLDEAGRLLFASNRNGHWQLWQAQADGSTARAVDGPLNAAGDIQGVLALGDRGDAVVSRVQADGQSRLHHAWCSAGQWQDGGPLPLSFNDGRGQTQAPGRDHSMPAELLLAGSADSPRAGGLDIYRTRAPHSRGDGSCH